VRGDLFERAPERVVGALELVHLQRAGEDAGHLARRIAVGRKAYRDPEHAPVGVPRAALVLHTLAGERAPEVGAEEFVGGRLVDLAQRAAHHLVRRLAEPGGGLARQEAHVLGGVDIGDDGARACGKGGEETLRVGEGLGD
jgi:hypothetical protein